jgi:hypothetical protein
MKKTGFEKLNKELKMTDRKNRVINNRWESRKRGFAWLGSAILPFSCVFCNWSKDKAHTVLYRERI